MIGLILVAIETALFIGYDQSESEGWLRNGISNTDNLSGLNITNSRCGLWLVLLETVTFIKIDCIVVEIGNWEI